MRITHLDDLRRLVKEERKRRGLTQRDAAGLVGFTGKWLSGFERGRTVPPADMVIRMVTLMGIRIEATKPLPPVDDGESVELGI